MKLDFTHGAILLAAAIGFLLGIEWLYAALGILFIALVFVEYVSQPAPKAMRVPPPAPVSPGAQPPVFVLASSPTDFVSTYLANLISDVYLGSTEELAMKYKGKYKSEVAEMQMKELGENVAKSVKGETEALKKEIEDLKKSVQAKGK